MTQPTSTLSQRDLLTSFLIEARTRGSVALVCATRAKADRLRWALYRVRAKQSDAARFRLAIRPDKGRSVLVVTYVTSPMSGVEIKSGRSIPQ